MMRMLPVSKKYILPWDSQISGAGLMAWQQSCVFSSNLIHMIKIHYFCFVEEDLTVSKLYYGKDMDSFLCTKGLIMVRSDDRALQMKQCLSLKTSIVC